MLSPNFSPDQFVDALSLNTAMSGIATSFREPKKVVLPGLARADLISFAATGLTLATTLPAPFGILFGNGDFATAHGTQTNADTQSYSNSFSGVVPASGSVTAYLLASEVSIQQGAIQIVGPPVGHPDFNPLFVPYTAYNSTVASVALAVSTTPPDNSTTFELARFTIAAGATGIGTANTNFRVGFSNASNETAYILTGAVSILPSQTGASFYANGAGAYTLPAVSGVGGATYTLIAGASGVSLQTTGADKIFGTGVNPSTGVSTISLPQGTAMTVQAVNGTWQTRSIAGITLIGGVPTSRNINTSQGLTGGGNLSSDLTLGFSRSVNAGTGLTGGGNLGAGDVTLSLNSTVLNEVQTFVTPVTGLSFTTFTFNLPSGFALLPGTSAPTVIEAWMVNVTPEGGWNANDVVRMPDGNGFGGSNNRNANIWGNTTQIGVAITNQGIALNLKTGSGGAFNITAANWNFYMVAKP